MIWPWPLSGPKVTTFGCPFGIDFSIFFEIGKSVKQVARAHGLSHKRMFGPQVRLLVRQVWVLEFVIYHKSLF